MRKSRVFSEESLRASAPCKSIKVFLPVTLLFIFCASAAMFLRPSASWWVAFGLSTLLFAWMYLGRLLASTSENLASDVKSLEVENCELVNKVKDAEETCKVNTQILTSMSHEIRTPLSAILGFMELLDDPSLPVEEHLEYLRIVRTNSEYLIKIVNDILDVSHLNSGKLTIEPKPTRVAEVLSSVLSMLKVKADEKGLELCIDFLSPIPGLVLIDEARLRQIVVNLVGNAIKFTTDGSVKVRVRCFPTSGENFVNLEVAVCDSGIGIPHSERENLFKMYSQVSSGCIDRPQGNGLGLAISKSLANMMGGDVSLLGSILGKGSSFIFNCPVTVVSTDNDYLPPILRCQNESQTVTHQH